jgi:hypothetical protein
MTLVQTLITREHILQVSDRRLTVSTGAVVDDAYNKAVSWCGDFAVGFTGIAFIDKRQRKPVSEWIAETLRGQSMVLDAAVALRDGLNAAVSELHDWPDRRLSVVMAGFPQPDSNHQRVPLQLRISNFERESSTFTSHQPEFGVDLLDLSDGSKFSYTTAGAHLNVREYRQLRRRLSRLIQERSWNNLIRLLVSVQRQVAYRDATVGKDAMIVSIPHTNLSPGTILTDVSSLDVTYTATMCTFIPDGGLSPQRFGPHFVCGDWALGNFRAEKLPGHAGNQSVSVRILGGPMIPPSD